MTHPNVLFVYRRNRAKIRAAKQRDEGPDEMLYGLDRLSADRFETDFIEDDESKRTPFRLMWRPVERSISRAIKMGFALPMIREQFDTVAHSDVVVSTVDTCGLPLAMLRSQGRLTVPLIYISQGLTDRLARLRPGSARRRLFTQRYRRYLQAVDRVVVLGHGAARPLIDLFGLPSQKVVCLPFGIDTDFWLPGQDRRSPLTNTVLSVGSDPSRDYQTLLTAAGNEVTLHVVTRTVLPHGLRGKKTTVSTRHTDVQLRQLYQDSAFVVIPLQDVAQPSGQSATLQAMACGKAVVLTKTKGLWEPDRLIHDQNCLLVEPGDVRQLRDTIDRLLKHPGEAARIGANARKTVEDCCTSQHFADRLATLIDQVLRDLSCA